MPFLSLTQDLNFEMPEAEPRWEACNAQEWEDALDPRTFTRATVRESVTSLIFDEGYPVSNNWSAFATTMLMHAVNIHMWHTLQCSQSSVSLEGTLATQAEHALARCYALLTVDRPEFEQHAESVEGPSMFNCQALLRSAYVRLFTGIGSFNRMMLLSGSQEQINSSIQAFVETPQERNSFLTKAVGKAYGGFLTPIKAGYLVVVKTAALSWSVEHAIAAWDCGTLDSSRLHFPTLILSPISTLHHQMDARHRNAATSPRPPAQRSRAAEPRQFPQPAGGSRLRVLRRRGEHGGGGRENVGRVPGRHVGMGHYAEDGCAFEDVGRCL